MVDGADQVLHPAVVAPHLEADGALAGRRQDVLGVERRLRLLAPPEASQAGDRQHGGVDVAVGQFADPGVHVAPQVLQIQVRT